MLSPVPAVYGTNSKLKDGKKLLTQCIKKEELFLVSFTTEEEHAYLRPLEVHNLGHAQIYQ